MGISDVGFLYVGGTIFGRIGHNSFCLVYYKSYFTSIFCFRKGRQCRFLERWVPKIFFRLMYVVKLVTKTRIMQKNEFF